MQLYSNFEIIFRCRHCLIIIIKMRMFGLSLNGHRPVQVFKAKPKTTYIRFMKWSCHMVGAPILKYKRPRNTFSTARDTIFCASMKANLFIRHYINVTEVLIQGLVFMCTKKQQQCVHNKYQTL